MSITPVDKPPDGDDSQDSPASSGSSRLREYAGRFFSWVGGVVAKARSTTDRETTASSRNDPSGRATPAKPEPVRASDCPSFENFPGREKPLTHPARNSSGINTPDVVSIETQDGLRLSVPENPDAQMTSDVWMDVEP